MVTSKSGDVIASAYFYSSLNLELSNESLDICLQFLKLNGLSLTEPSLQYTFMSSTALMNAVGAKVIEASDALEV